MAKKKSRAKSRTRADSAPAPAAAPPIPAGFAPDRSPQQRADGWANVLNGLGDANFDYRQSSKFKSKGPLPQTTLTALWRENGFAKRIVKLPPVEMTRNWFTINGDDEDRVLQQLETLGAQEKYKMALTWARLYGGSIILMGLDDSKDLWRPVNEARVKNVMFLKVFDRTDVEVRQESISTDPADPLFGEPTKYRVTPVTGGAQFTVHASRLIRFDGEKLPGRTLQTNNWWHDSVLTSIFEQIRQIGAVYDSSEFIVNDFVQTIIKIENLMQMIAQGKEDLIKERLNLIDMSKHVANSILLDAKEEYTKHASSVAGLDKLLEKFMMMVSAVTGIPVTLLMGRSPAGQNATGESDIRMWYDSIRSEQRSSLRPRLEPLIRILFKVTGGEPEMWSVEFNPLWEMTDKERSDIYKLNAEGDDSYIANGSVNSLQIATHRFGGSQYNPTPPTIPQDDLDEQETAANMAAEERERMAAEAEAARAEALRQSGEE